MGRSRGRRYPIRAAKLRTTLRALRGVPMVMPHAPMTTTNLLLVEDDEFVRLSLARALNRTGVFAVLPAENGQQPLERSEEHTSELQSPCNLVCRLLLEKKKKTRPAPSATQDPPE